MLERQQHRHQLRDARDRDARPGTVLREHLPRPRVLDDERACRNRRGTGVCGSGEGERRDGGGDADPQDHETERYLTRMRWPIRSAAGSVPGLSVANSSTVVPYFWAM